MKITWILDNINTVNGMVRVVIGLSNFLTEKGHDVLIVSFYSETATPFFSLHPEVRVQNLGKDWRKLSRFDKHRILGGIMQNSDADIMLTCNEWANSSAILNKRRFSGKLIATQHMSYDSFSGRRRAINIILQRFADKFVVLTEADRTFYEKYGMHNLVVIPNAVYTETMDLSNKQKVICAVGRVEYAKGFDLLIKAFARIATEFPEWKLRILGDGSQREELIAAIHDLGLTHQIEMPGMSHAVAQELAQSSIYALSSRHEGFGLTLVEAMNAKNAIVAFEIPCTWDVLTTASAIVVPPENIKAFASALHKMISDEKLRESAGIAAYEEAQKYSVACIVEKWINLFDSLLGGRD